MSLHRWQPPFDQEFPRRAVVKFAAPPTKATVTPHRYPDAAVEGMRRALSPFRVMVLEGARESKPHGGSDIIPIYVRRPPRDSTSRKAHESAAHNSGVIPDTNTDNAELGSDASRTLRPARAHEPSRAHTGMGMARREVMGLGRRTRRGIRRGRKRRRREGEGVAAAEAFAVEENGTTRVTPKSKVKAHANPTLNPTLGDIPIDKDSGTRAGRDLDLAAGVEVGSKRKRPRADAEGRGVPGPAAKRSRKGTRETRSADGAHAQRESEMTSDAFYSSAGEVAEREVNANANPHTIPIPPMLTPNRTPRGSNRRRPTCAYTAHPRVGSAPEK
ncbi:hypothetical protein K438DRAFT_167673 [Mycena galopus ATCC 62051]|nr:hypothetical protein K438DRAFT_167673 [Mycena galopus ATCC 62051]